MGVERERAPLISDEPTIQRGKWDPTNNGRKLTRILVGKIIKLVETGKIFTSISTRGGTINILSVNRGGRRRMKYDRPGWGDTEAGKARIMGKNDNVGKGD